MKREGRGREERVKRESEERVKREGRGREEGERNNDHKTESTESFTTT